MNISQPVASSIGSVDFGILSSDEIRGISAKRIQNPETFDTLLHPTPGGLYDLALGAWGDYTCTTCSLKTFTCPGHAGHIELPVPVYHVTYMDQLLRLLQSQCPYCLRFRLSRTRLNAYICKLLLLQHGLIPESKEIDLLDAKQVFEEDETQSARNRPPAQDDEIMDAEQGDDDLIQVQTKFTQTVIANAEHSHGFESAKGCKTEAVLEARRAVIAELFLELPRPLKCSVCMGRPYRWRKDKFSKIFRDSKAIRETNARNNFGQQVENPLLLAVRAAKAARLEKKADRDADEGIDIQSDDMSEESSDVTDAQNNGLSNSTVDVSASTATAKSSSSSANQYNEFVNTEEVYATIVALFKKEQTLLNLLYSVNKLGKTKKNISPDIFFIRTLLVPPNKYRPDAKTGAGQITEAQQNSLYKRILTSCIGLHQLQKELRGEVNATYRQRDFNDLQTAWVALQDCVNALFDSERSTAPRRGAKEPEEGIKQRLEKKEGLFRMNMMGKRVNFAARSVISPDPNIETNEIGVPPVFAKKLTFPEPVTHHNNDSLRAAIMNGPNKWPGAAAIENENGQIISLANKTAEERQALANQLLAPSSTGFTGGKNKKVHRHLNNGDILIMNRQPTLHKPSMMCHRARVLPGEKTIRMHYANCNTYNADFDGDEMNMHFPQSQIARAEAIWIANTDNQYLVATSGKPLRGLIQDHLSMGVWLTNRDTLFERGDYQQLLYSCLRPEDLHTTTDRILTVPPAIIKPIAMWTGKQVITTILRNIKPKRHPGLTMAGKSSTPAEAWSEQSEERDVIFQEGHFLCGILDKAHLGPTNGGLVHSVYEAYGNDIAGKLLSVLGRLLTKFLHMRAWSCGIEDIVLSEVGDLKRTETLKDADNIGLEVASKYVSLPEAVQSADVELRDRLADVLRDKEKHAGLDSVYSTRNAKLSSAVTSACLPTGLWKPFPRNQMQTMTVSGAKGSIVNANQISCNLGQQTLEGRRVPVMVSGKTLPSFKPYETDIRAGGYIVNRFLTGVQPQEYYFHAMAGREGLIDTAVKTARSGYLQRCLIKGMEGLRVEYDSSVRDADGSLVQFLYGEDGLDVTKQKHLNDFKFVAQNFWSFIININVQEVLSKLEEGKAAEWNKKVLKKLRKGHEVSMDPVTAHFNPSSHFGSTSEAFSQALKSYLERNPDKLIKDKKQDASDATISKKNFQSLMDMKYLRSVVEPGEAVGIVAGQSIGEPSTQMTLNTFHLAGHAAKNVTLGIPRLREIVMTASTNIMTPTMTLHLNADVDNTRAQAFVKGLSKLSLAEALQSVKVTETVGRGLKYDQARTYHVTLELYDAAELEQEYAISLQDVSQTIEKTFLQKLVTAVNRDLKTKTHLGGSKPSSSQPQIGVTAGRSEDIGGDDEDAENAENAEKVDRARAEVDSEDENGPDDDATQFKMKNKTVDNYDDSEDEANDSEDNDSVRHDHIAEEPEDEGYVGSPRLVPQERRKATHWSVKAYEERILNKYRVLSAFHFDFLQGSTCDFALEYEVKTPKVIMLNHIEAVCRSALIQFIPGIGACALSEEKAKDPKTKKDIEVPVVITEGINLLAMRDYQDDIDPHMILTNDIGAMLKHYGVEAARATIIREMSAVFEGHSIQVDNRHLNLIADMMTRHGGFAPFNRFGLRSSSSPFMRMSFETTVGFLKDAVLAAERDALANPSARLVAGKTSGVGTGAFDVMVPISTFNERRNSPISDFIEV